MMNVMGADERESSRQPVSSPSPHVVDVKRQSTSDYVIYLFLSHISWPLLHNFVDFKLTDFGVLSNYLFGPREAGKSFINSSSQDAFNARTRVVHSLTPFLTKASLCLPRVFPSYIYSAPSSFSFISSWLIIERDRERPSLVTPST